jgi:hypothetical protein
VRVTEESGEEQLTHKQKQENRIVERAVKIVKDQLTVGVGSIGIGTEQLSKFMRFMESARLIAGSALAAAMLAAIYEYLALMGVADVSPARVVLIGAWIFGSLFLWEIVGALNWSKTKKAWTAGILAIIMAVGFIGLDLWALNWKIKHPPDTVELQSEVHNLVISVQQLSTNKTTKTHVTSDQPEIKAVTQIAGYLKLKFSYPRLPVEQANKAASLDALFFNRGSTYVHEASMKGQLYYVDFRGVKAPQHSPEAVEMIHNMLAKLDALKGSDIAPGDAIWSSYDTQTVLTEGMVQAMNLGTARVYFAAYVDWKSLGGVGDHVNTCKWLQPSSWLIEQRQDLPRPDMTKTEPVWHEC